MNEYSTGWQFNIPTFNFDQLLLDPVVSSEVKKNLVLTEQFWGAASDTRVENGRLQGLINGQWYDVSSFEGLSNGSRNLLGGTPPAKNNLTQPQSPIDIAKIWPFLALGLLILALLVRK